MFKGKEPYIYIYSDSTLFLAGEAPCLPSGTSDPDSPGRDPKANDGSGTAWNEFGTTVE